VPQIIDYNWFNNSLGGERLLVRHTDPAYTAGKYLITVLCDAVTCNTKYTIQVKLTEAPGSFTVEGDLFDVDVDHSGLRKHYSTSGINWTAADWIPVCITNPMPSINLIADFMTSRDRVMMLMQSKSIGLHKEIGATDVRNITSLPVFSNISLSSYSAALHISNQSAGLQPGAAYVGIFTTHAHTDTDLFKLNAWLTTSFTAAPIAPAGVVIALYPDEFVQSIFNSTLAAYNYYSVEVTHPCTDIVLTLDYATDVPVGASLQLLISRHEVRPTTLSYSWSSHLNSAAVVVKPKGTHAVRRIVTVPYSDDMFGTGTYAIAVFCANSSTAGCMVHYNMSVHLSVQDGGNLARLSQVQQGSIVWFRTCIANLSRTFLVTTSSHTATTAQIVVRRSAILPSRENHPWRGPSWRGSVATNATSNVQLTASGTSFALQGNIESKFVLSKDLIGFAPGPLYIGIYTTCLISRPYYAPNPQPWADYNSYSRCDPSTSFNLQGRLLPTGRIIKLQAGQVLTGTVRLHEVAQYDFVLTGICSELQIYLTSVSGDADVYASNSDHLASWTSSAWSSRKTGNDYSRSLEWAETPLEIPFESQLPVKAARCVLQRLCSGLKKPNCPLTWTSKHRSTQRAVT
jgi:hypothetical protein